MVGKTYKLEGMHCDSCATMLELDFEEAGLKAKCDYAKQLLTIEDSDDDEVKKIVKKSGYSLSEK